MQLLVIRHALPLRSEPGEGADPNLSEDGIEQAKRLPDALARFPITRIVSSPQRRAIQTAQPVADALGLTIDIDERVAEYDYGLSHYVPIEEASEEDVQRLIAGHLPGNVDQDAFIARVNEGVADIVAGAGHEDTVALVCHGGVINALVHTIMQTERLLCVQVDYAGVTRLLSSRTGKLGVASVNGTEHVWDLLPRNQRW
ncbi:histidine phosphatase family protein [Mycolicibacterium arenosum]|uniref:Histidine phosphatase family protein n=1 Tax=Mycolicibacterium arenosum TaxID=2952157 RepID=A0ABT1M9L8_9MYCO|nr:histidine phosphatase family protein [Mycolicibacterium sp. CAU 1645]MCP9275869.1 histidine phosphatase family protein [Mycolicibacterium sp. CAU 1645]